jgi:Flp pilus assembly protein TadB
MRVQYVQQMSQGSGKRSPLQPNPRWLIIAAIICAVIAGLIALLAPAVVVLFGVLSGVFVVWGVGLWILNVFR